VEARPETTNDSISAGPVLSWAAMPVSTKMPVPMMAPTPRAESWTGPRTRRSRFSPFISSRRSARGFLAKRGLAMGLSGPPERELCPRLSRGGRARFPPGEVHGNAGEHDDQPWQAGRRLVDQQHDGDHGGRHDVEGRDHRIAEGAVRPLRVRPLAPQHE